MHQLNQRQLQLHVPVVGWLHILGGALFLLGGIFIFVLLTGIGAASGEPEAIRILGVIGTAVGLLLVGLAIPGFIAGYGLLTRRAWGRILALVVGILDLVNIPLGTLVGLYTLWVLLQEAATDYFRSEKLAPDES